MTVSATWPDKLPRPTFTGYSVEPVDGVLRTDMESGPARQRRRSTQTPSREPVRWRFTAWQFALFESWYKHKAREGAAWFSIDLLGGLGMVTHEARFMGAGAAPYKAVPSRGGKDGVRWIVTSTLEVRERPVLSEDALDLLLTEDAAGLIAVAGSFNTLINTTLPANPW